MAGSAIALLVGRLNRKKSESDLRQIDRLIELADRALVAQASELKVLEEELNGIIAWFVKGQARELLLAIARNFPEGATNSQLCESALTKQPR